MLFMLATAFAVTTPNLYIEGTCPGPATVRVTHAAPGARVAIVRGTGPGSFVIPAGGCAGVDVGLASPAIATTGTVSASGERTWTPTLGAPACGMWLVAVDLDTCRVSAPMPVTPPATDRWDITLDVPTLFGAGSVARNGAGWAVSWYDLAGDTGLAQISDTGVITRAIGTGATLATLVSGPQGLVALGAAQYDPALFGWGFEDPTISSLDGALNARWTTTFDHPTAAGFFTAAFAPGGEMFAGGEFEAMVGTGGQVLWTADRFGDDGHLNFADAGTSSFLATGWMRRPGLSDYEAAAFRIAPDGSTIWGYRYRAGPHTVGGGIYDLGTDAYVVAFDDEFTGSATYLIRVDATGAPIWSRRYAAPGYSSFGCYKTVPTWAGFLHACNAWDDAGNSATVVMKTDPDGEVQWARDHGPGSAWDAQPAGHLGMVIVGADGAGNARVLRVDANGQSGCDVPFTVEGAPAMIIATPEPGFVAAPTTPVLHPTFPAMTASIDAVEVCR